MAAAFAKAKAAALLNEGLDLLKKAHESSPEDVNVRFNYGIALYLAGRLPEAAEQLRGVIASKPNDGDAYYVLAKTLAGQNDPTATTVDNQARTYLTVANRYANLEKELLADIIPLVESRYAAKADREHRALAGLSMGGGQSLNFGLNNLDHFAWVGGFSSAPNTKKVDDLVKDPAEAAKKLRLLWVSCGDRDNLMRISRAFHEALDESKVPHVWHINSGGHDFAVWKTNLYHFVPLLFR